MTSGSTSPATYSFIMPQDCLPSRDHTNEIGEQIEAFQIFILALEIDIDLHSTAFFPSINMAIDP